MDKQVLDGLLGPFPMGTPPVRQGFFVVAVNEAFHMWFWSGSAWMDSDDGLGDKCPAELASGWYGKFDPGNNDGLAEGLEG